jgi:hypothetical protein
MRLIFVLLVVYQLKHFLADYPLQGTYMLGKFKLHGWVRPLAAHAGVHGLLTLAIALLFIGKKSFFVPVALAVFDFTIHFTMDRIKASPNMLGRFKDFYDKRFWWSLGFDQMVHHLTHYTIIYVLVRILLGY